MGLIQLILSGGFWGSFRLYFSRVRNSCCWGGCRRTIRLSTPAPRPVFL